MRRDPWRLRAANRLYAVALRIWPQALREHHGHEMRGTFDALARDAASTGRLTLVRLLAREVIDLTRTARAARAIAREDARPGLQRSAQRRVPVNALWHDVRYAVRMLRRYPGFALVSVMTLALGIGANTAVFTVVNGVLLRPLPYKDPDRLVLLLYGRPERMGTSYSPPNYYDVANQSGVFESHAALNQVTANMTGRGDPQRIDGAEVTWPFFSTLGVVPQIGRAFVESDAAGDPRIAVLSDGFWRREFGRRPDVVGSVVQMDGQPTTIVGVAPPGFGLPRNAEFWRLLVFPPNQLAPRARGAQWLTVLARLAPGVTLARANEAMGSVARRLSDEFPLTNRDRRMGAALLHERMVRDVKPALLLLLGAVTLVLLIACVNVANLLLARAQSRSREVAVRAALGAGRGRLIRQFLAESLVLGVAGGAAGLLVAFWCTRALTALGPTSIPRLADVGIDWRVLGFTLAIAIGTSVVFGLAPAVAATGGGLARFIVGAGRGSIGSAGTRTRKTLVVSELALAVVLLAGAGLLIRSYERIAGVDPGFSADRVLTFHLALPEAKYRSAAAVQQFTATFVDRLGHEPGVEHAAAVLGLPLDSDFSISTSFRRGTEPDSADTPSAGMRVVTPDYFATLKIPLRSGRLFDGRDDAAGPEVVVINEEAARRFWPGQDPVGQLIHIGVRLVPGVRSGDKQIVGIVGNVKYGGLDVGPPPEIYLPHAQHPVGDATIAVRTIGDPLTFVPTARAVLAGLDRELPIADVLPMTSLIGRSIAERRFTMLLLASFAFVAVALAAIGIYGLLVYVVTQRTPEIGVRLAMGATAGDVIGLFVREGVILTIVGVACGAVAALAGARTLTTLLFGVAPTDPATFVGVAAALMVVALAASYVPARRAARVDPMTALRAE